MEKEGRLNKKKKEGDEDDQEEEQTEEQNEENKWPEPEDCFEYKLVGVNIHSGSA